MCHDELTRFISSLHRADYDVTKVREELASTKKCFADARQTKKAHKDTKMYHLSKYVVKRRK